jgi:hypothetical protein
MEEHKIGNFKSLDLTFLDGDCILAEQMSKQPGTSGYLVAWDYLRHHRDGRMVIDCGARIARYGTHETILVTATKKGFMLEFLNLLELPPSTISDSLPGPNAIPVQWVKVGKMVYEKWNEDLRLVPFYKLPISDQASYFVEQHRIGRAGRYGFRVKAYYGSAKKNGGKGRLPIRRLTDSHFQVQTPKGHWVDLVMY